MCFVCVCVRISVMCRCVRVHCVNEVVRVNEVGMLGPILGGKCCVESADLFHTALATNYRKRDDRSASGNFFWSFCWVLYSHPSFLVTVVILNPIHRVRVRLYDQKGICAWPLWIDVIFNFWNWFENPCKVLMLQNLNRVCSLWMSCFQDLCVYAVSSPRPNA